jgi:hypothetical protein
LDRDGCTPPSPPQQKGGNATLPSSFPRVQPLNAKARSGVPFPFKTIVKAKIDETNRIVSVESEKSALMIYERTEEAKGRILEREHGTERQRRDQDGSGWRHRDSCRESSHWPRRRGMDSYRPVSPAQFPRARTPTPLQFHHHPRLQ